MSAGSIDSWGPALWRFLHASSFAFPEEPERVRRVQMHEFLRSVGQVLPCQTCREHYNQYIQEHLDESATANRENLVAWVVELHNAVNRRTGKREWSVDEVRRMYEKKMGGASSCPYTIRRVPPPSLLVWVLIVTLAAVVGLFVAARVRELPN